MKLHNKFFLLVLLLISRGIAIAAVPDIVINEFMASNATVQKDPAGEYEDWIELHNNTNTDIDVSNWYLSDNFSWRKKWKFPVGTSITAHGYLIIWCDSQVTQAGLHSTYKLNKGGEEIILCKPDTSLSDSVTFGKQITDTSYSRIPNGSGPFTFTKPTFNMANSPEGINRFDHQEYLLFFPNPAKSQLFLLADKINSVTIYNDIMKETRCYHPDYPYEIYVGDLPKGLYFIEIEGANTRIIKQLIIR